MLSDVVQRGRTPVIRAAVVGLGWWGKTLVESVQGESAGIRFVAAATRTRSTDAEAYAAAYDLRLGDFEAALAADDVDAVVLATPHSVHAEQTIAAAQAGKHVFCEKPFALTGEDAEAAVAAAQEAGVAVAVGYNRRFHPEMTNLRERIRSGGLGTILHVEATMTFANALALEPGQWRAHRDETPAGGLTPMGVHAVDGMIDLCGEIDHVFCQSFRRVVEIDADDTTSVLFRMREGMSGYLGTMTATGPGFSFQVFGSEGSVRLEGMTHRAGASSEERRTRLFGTCKFQPVQGEAEVWEAERFDVTRAALEAFAVAAEGGPAYPITPAEIVHGAAVTSAIVRSAASGQVEWISETASVS
jgi:predicted dehydrogenase